MILVRQARECIKILEETHQKTPEVGWMVQNQMSTTQQALYPLQIEARYKAQIEELAGDVKLFNKLRCRRTTAG
jgi:hypothetical protein